MIETAEQLLASLMDDIDRLFDQYAHGRDVGRNVPMLGVDEVQSRLSCGSTSSESQDKILC